jgi:hypothetical protein
MCTGLDRTEENTVVFMRPLDILKKYSQLKAMILREGQRLSVDAGDVQAHCRGRQPGGAAVGSSARVPVAGVYCIPSECKFTTLEVL